jgi:hypothetical protein
MFLTIPVDFNLKNPRFAVVRYSACTAFALIHFITNPKESQGKSGIGLLQFFKLFLKIFDKKEQKND